MLARGGHQILDLIMKGQEVNNNTKNEERTWTEMIETYASDLVERVKSLIKDTAYGGCGGTSY
ncbi:MAG: hypothetical protein ACE5JA_04675 [bacterium]